MPKPKAMHIVAGGWLNCRYHVPVLRKVEL